jgi:hypothetical protein
LLTGQPIGGGEHVGQGRRRGEDDGGVDSCRGETRNRIIAATTEAVRRLAPSRTPAKVEASAVARYVLVATAVASLLQSDEVFRTLGPSKFRREVEQLAHNISGPRRSSAGTGGRKQA